MSSAAGPITIFCASDGRYAMYLATMLRSLDANHQGPERIQLYVIDLGISAFDRWRVRRSLWSGKIDLVWIPERAFDAHDPSGALRALGVPYYRLLAPRVLPASTRKALYLDCDLIMCGDVAELWRSDLAGHVVGAVQDAAAHTIDWRQGIRNHVELGLDPKAKYFNTGVMLVDLERWRAERVCERVAECTLANAAHVILDDQYGLNVVLHGRWQELESRWNQFPYVPRAAGEPGIVHYVTKKPEILFFESDYRRLFFRYMYMTAFAGSAVRLQSEWHLNRLRRAARPLRR